MIEKTSAYKTADGVTHLNLEAAQKHALLSLFSGGDESYAQCGAADVLKNKDAVIAILKLKPRKERKPKKATKAPAAKGPQ